jgi:hypothetical protein
LRVVPPITHFYFKWRIKFKEKKLCSIMFFL